MSDNGAMSSVDLLLHPVRIRIIQALLDGSTLTTKQLMAQLTDVPSASLYRHIATLTDAGVLMVVGETPVRGTIERAYALHLPRAGVGSDEARQLGIEDHRRAFAAYVATLLADFDRYLDGPDPDPVADGVSFTQVALWLSDDELTALDRQLAETLSSLRTNRAGAGRTKRLLSTVLMPQR